MKKQKIVLQITKMYCSKCRKQAMEIAAGTEGVSGLEIEGEDQDRLVLVGEGIDVATLATTLRRKVGHTELISVKEVKEEGGENVQVDKNDCSCGCTSNDGYYPPPPPPPPGYYVCGPAYPNTWFTW